MGLISIKTFHWLRQQFKPQAMGFACGIGTISRFNARMSLAQSFRGIRLEGYREPTVRGYDALFRVFLTHSALECFCDVYGYDKKWPTMGQHLAPVIAPYDPTSAMRIFRERDNTDKLYIFLRQHLIGESLKNDLKACKERRSENIVAVSAAIRHMFAHGVLTANANQMSPRAAHEIGTAIADFLLGMMDAEFTNTINTFCERQGILPDGVEGDTAGAEPELTGGESN